MAAGTTGVVGWRIHMDETEFAASFRGPDGVNVFTVTGFPSRREAGEFVAFYLVAMATRHQSGGQGLNDLMKSLSMKQS